jgi:Flp pilus assembly protein TadD
MKILSAILIHFLLTSYLSSQESTLKYETAFQFYKNAAYQDSINLLEERIKKNQHTINDHLLISQNYWKLGNETKAIDQLYSALKMKPNDTEIYIELIKAYTASNRYRGGLEIAETAQNKFPDSKEIKYLKTFLQGKLGMINSALKTIEDLKQESPNDTRPLGIEANLYFLQGEFEKAELSLKWALSIKEDSPFLHNNLALVYEKSAEQLISKGKKEEAKSALLDAKKSIDRAISIKEHKTMAETKKRIEDKLVSIP